MKRAMRGLFIPAEEFKFLLNDLLAEARKRKDSHKIIGSLTAAKLDGAIISILAIEEAAANLSIPGDLILAEKEDTANDKEPVVNPEEPSAKPLVLPEDKTEDTGDRPL